MGADHTDFEFRSAGSNLRLHAQVWGPPDAALTVLCLHGLTRNAADFGFIARRLSARYRVIAADQRGRGKSEWDPDPSNYHPGTYVADTFALLDELGVDRFAVIGTSLGGLMAILMGASQPARIRGMVLNDIGPEIPVLGLQQLRDALNARAPSTTWAEAALQSKRLNETAFPDYDDEQWEAFARRTYVEDSSGHPIAAFDPGILKALNATDLTAVQTNFWPLWKHLESIPLLAIRGALSDIISPEILDAMGAEHADFTALTVPNRGHAPMLDEPPAVQAIDAFLKKLETM
jgi:pimeloyl-ACP methyl ester carboxylesterase